LSTTLICHISILYSLVSFHQFQRTLHLEHRYRPRRSLRLAIGHRTSSILHRSLSGRHWPSRDEHTHHHSSKPVCIGNRAHCPPCIIIIVHDHHHHRAVFRHHPSAIVRHLVVQTQSLSPQPTFLTSASIPTPRFRTRADIKSVMSIPVGAWMVVIIGLFSLLRFAVPKQRWVPSAVMIDPCYNLTVFGQSDDKLGDSEPCIHNVSFG
jgi:hypothetical protein